MTTADYGLLQQLKALSTSVSAAAQDVKADEEMAEDAPDEFKVPACLPRCRLPSSDLSRKALWVQSVAKRQSCWHNSRPAAAEGRSGACRIR